MKMRIGDPGDRLWVWVWGFVGAVVLIAGAVITLGADDRGTVAGAGAESSVAEMINPLGTVGNPDGEGLSPVSLRAVSGLSDDGEGRSSGPTATIDGPGRRLFGGVTVRLPRGTKAFVMRQVVPGDPGVKRTPGSVVTWAGYVSVVPGTAAPGSSLPRRLNWKKTDVDGVTVPAGATVRMRTMFRVTDDAGACVGGTGGATARQRAATTLRRAPAWMIRPAGPRESWRWLRVSTLEAGEKTVRTGADHPVVFRGSSTCATPQPRSTVDPDPDPLSASSSTLSNRPLPLDRPDGF